MTIVTTTHRRDLVNELVEIQHDAEAEIVCTTHVHLDHHHCLEVIVCVGRRHRPRPADRLVGLKGVKHGDLTMSSGDTPLR